MSLVINNNMMAASTARILGNTYDRLSASTQRLSSGLRINGAADDAAGLAIRELMRADIATMQQGIRNAADGISLLQTAEGGMAILDEKLVRMKELAEQAATGTYTTVQREIINSEYQAMAAEIDRIATATNFNGVKLLDGSMSSIHQGLGLKIHFGTGNSAAEDYYFVQIGDVRATSQSGLRIGGDAKNDIWGTVGTHGGPNTTGCCGGGIPSLNEPVPGWKSGEVFSFGYDWDWKQHDETKLKAGRYIAGAWQADSTPTLQELMDMVNKGSQARVRMDFQYGSQSSQTMMSGLVSAYYYVDLNGGKHRVDVPAGQVTLATSGQYPGIASGAPVASSYSYIYTNAAGSSITVSVPANQAVYSATAGGYIVLHSARVDVGNPAPVSGHITLTVKGQAVTISQELGAANLKASATAAKGFALSGDIEVRLGAPAPKAPRISGLTLLFPTAAFEFSAQANKWYDSNTWTNEVTFSGVWNPPGTGANEPSYTIAGTTSKLSDNAVYSATATTPGWVEFTSATFAYNQSANIAGPPALGDRAAYVTIGSVQFPPADIAYDGAGGYKTSGGAGSTVTVSGNWDPAQGPIAFSYTIDDGVNPTVTHTLADALTAAGLTQHNNNWGNLGTATLNGSAEIKATYVIPAGGPLNLAADVEVAWADIEWGNWNDLSNAPYDGFRLKTALAEVTTATVNYTVAPSYDPAAAPPTGSGWTNISGWTGSATIGATVIKSPPATIAKDASGTYVMSKEYRALTVATEALNMETSTVLQKVFVDKATGTRYLELTDKVQRDGSGSYILKDATKPDDRTYVVPDMTVSSGGVTLAGLLGQASAANSAYSAANVVADKNGIYHYLWSSAAAAAALGFTGISKGDRVTSAHMEKLLGVAGYKDLASAIGTSAIMANSAYSLAAAKGQPDYLGHSAMIMVPNVAGGAHRICLGDEIYYIGSAGLGRESFEASKTLAAVSLSAMVSSAGFWNSQANPFGSGRSWETIWAVSALAFAINNNPKSQYWARLETGGAGEYRQGYTSLYVYCKDGGDKRQIKACDEQMGDIRSCVEQYNKIVWYNDEMEAATSAGTYFNNGGKDWGTLKAVPTGYGSWGVQLHGKDVGKYRDLWILNVGGMNNADIQTDQKKGFTGLGFGLGADGKAINNLLGLDRQSFVEVQNADDGPWAGAHVRTQSDAQEALDAIQAAIERKDKVRATLGAYINRLENTISNLEMQAENLQASESRISDVDLATEMTQFVKNQVLTQAAVSMLSQANSLPQMALSLLNG